MTTSLSTEELHITVPMPANISNGSHSSWQGRHGQKLAYWKQLDERQNVGLIPPPPPRPFTKATLRSTMHLGAAMDDSNAMRRHKWVEDWLTTRGYIADDRKKVLTWEGFPEQRLSRYGERKIELVLTDRSR